ncbi:hypothetical protein H112_00568 [Trichophyton rubrum D6]|uniref:Uncharacterized protein n=2 Tax=Trichophyton TaxID=5550 RepID=A0A022WFM9_TRIRU|nr:hypothetical protein H100_00567 [Trichophyton rubrum MR850]EZF57157.1 hypothetical protein H103_00567 [Trichophyton rubrum CBS 288.86]EZF67726.1 hypothetical protein H104_00557 [Trichophyton rubrum CBS 289.86]EZF78400.1 hypothetical protein H105_00555 [Trichophyton soudanense CBS 452.61]EZF89096.1 hypothetical protein H110_00571 [Trichophyton rubrum MR1448]EZG21373.1 hypothetical protein H107_00615 [Trichophyton rubrum CBS 202.88]KDB38263.1 hypothetical protein H112_00568 [Trichophyton rub
MTRVFVKELMMDAATSLITLGTRLTRRKKKKQQKMRWYDAKSDIKYGLARVWQQADRPTSRMRCPLANAQQHLQAVGQTGILTPQAQTNPAHPRSSGTPFSNPPSQTSPTTTGSPRIAIAGPRLRRWHHHVDPAKRNIKQSDGILETRACSA